jgi:hypothetical protein
MGFLRMQNPKTVNKLPLMNKTEIYLALAVLIILIKFSTEKLNAHVYGESFFRS